MGHPAGRRLRRRLAPVRRPPAAVARPRRGQLPGRPGTIPARPPVGRRLKPAYPLHLTPNPSSSARKIRSYPFACNDAIPLTTPEAVSPAAGSSDEATEVPGAGPGIVPFLSVRSQESGHSLGCWPARFEVPVRTLSPATNGAGCVRSGMSCDGPATATPNRGRGRSAHHQVSAAELTHPAATNPKATQDKSRNRPRGCGCRFSAAGAFQHRTMCCPRRSRQLDNRSARRSTTSSMW